MNYAVVTTINNPTKAIEVLHEKFGKNLIVVGDLKTPYDWGYKDVTYIPPSQNEDYCVKNHYARKNIGYMEAIKRGATCIYSSDDDNLPNADWQLRFEKVSAIEAIDFGWHNVYYDFSDEHIWPRGFPLKRINKVVVSGISKSQRISSIQQGLANGEPDVDAIWRLVYNKKIKFDKRKSVYLGQGSWCPINSQATWFFPRAFPLMYLPITVSMRMTDIFSGLIAQRCLWEIGEGVTFHSPPEVYQDRNEHDLLKDFEDEIQGYLNSDRIADILGTTKLKPGQENMCDNLLTCYEVLTEEKIFKPEEISSVKAWIKDYEQFAGNMG